MQKELRELRADLKRIVTGLERKCQISGVANLVGMIAALLFLSIAAVVLVMATSW